MKLTSKIYGLSLVPIILLLGGLLLSGIFVNLSNQATKIYVSDYVERHNKLYEIFRSFGYGGGIHAFKNYVLRFDEHYFSSVTKHLEQTKRLIQQYQEFSPLSSIEKNAMKKLSETVDQYLSNVAIVKTMIKRKHTQIEIDRAVKVDDRPAILALEKLQYYFVNKHQVEITNLQQANKRAFNIQVILFIIALLVALVMGHAISKKILYSIKKMMNLSHEISMGNYDLIKSKEVNLEDDEFQILTEQMITMSENLQEAFDKLHRSNEQLAEFAFVASHDLQEPIKKVSTYVDLLEMEIQKHSEEPVRKYMNEIKNSTRRMIKLINELLNYSQLSNLEMSISEVCLVEIVEIAKNNLEIVMQQTNAQIITSELPLVMGNKELLQSLFQNLISNAIKFKKENMNPVIKISANKMDEDYWQISIEDNGIGFDLEYVDTVLRPFGRIHAHKNIPGVGIGLPLCKKILECHESEFIIESVPQRGSVFSFRLKSAS